jgi:toxin CcdB
MPKFLDVIEPIKSQRGRGIIGFIVFQSDYAIALDTILVIPCRDLAANLDLGKLTPRFELGGKMVLAIVPQMAGIGRRELGTIVFGSAALIRDDLIAALDALVTGF